MQGWYKANIKRGQRDMRQVLQMAGAPRRLSIRGHQRGCFDIPELIVKNAAELLAKKMAID